VKHIAIRYGITPQTSQSSDGPIDFSAEQQAVIDFLHQDDISRVGPGIRDRVILREKGKEKEIRVKRHLLLTLCEAHSLYCNDNPMSKVAFSTFANIRKKFCPEVLVTGDICQSSCLCLLHENFIK
jgi:hypothetical protein